MLFVYDLDCQSWYRQALKVVKVLDIDISVNVFFKNEIGFELLERSKKDVLQNAT